MYSIRFLCPKNSITAAFFLTTALICSDQMTYGALPVFKSNPKKRILHKKIRYLNATAGFASYQIPKAFDFYSTSTGLAIERNIQELSSTTLNFPEQNINTSSAAQSFTIRGSSLKEEVIVITNMPFTLSKDSSHYQGSLTFSTAELVSAKKVYVKFSPASTGNHTGSVVSLSGGAENKVVDLTGTAIDKNSTTTNPQLSANNLITPNGDGRNDTWIIENIEYYPNNNVKVFDHTGRVVYSKQGYTNDWNGTYNNGPLPQGTYYYLVEFSPGLSPFKGFITIVRD